MVDDLLRLLNTKLFITKTVGELISGYQDPLMALAKMFLPEVIKDDKFSLINGVRNIRLSVLDSYNIRFYLVLL